MTVLEEAPPRASAPKPPEKPPIAPRRNGFANYFTKYGWIHALLLLSVWMFLFPFFWMLATSVKTDEELTEPHIMPEFVTFRSASPYVRRPIQPHKPTDVETARWEQMLPQLTQIAESAVAKYQSAQPPQDSIAAFDNTAHRRSAAAIIVDGAVAKLNRRLWTGDATALLSNYRAAIDDKSIAAALSDSLSRIDLIGFQMRTLDLRNFSLTDGADFAKNWIVESGPAKLYAVGDRTLLSYHFDSASSPPIVLRYDFHFPPGVAFKDLHKLTLSMSADNSWHRLNLSLDVAGQHWASNESTYLAQHRVQSYIFQPPTFDDQLLRAKVWVSLKKEDSPSTAPPVVASSAEGIPATVRVTITPSNTLVANWGKVWRNYDRAFKAVPFWRYIINSVILVVLCTGGSLFSAAFVGYAFARLRWPGRSVAFLLLLSTIMLPSQVTMIPGFMVWRAVHWYNTLNPLWVPAFFGTAFFIFLMVQHMKTIPRELEEAARIDGLNAVQSWYYVMLPNVKPTLAAIAILSFMGSWNEFMGPLIYLRDQTKFPLSLGLYGLGLMRVDSGADYSWTVVMAGNMLMTVPVILVFFLFQRYFVQGMTLTGMKG